MVGAGARSVIRCDSCGFENADGARLCASCNAFLDWTDPPADTSRPHRPSIADRVPSLAAFAGGSAPPPTEPVSAPQPAPSLLSVPEPAAVQEAAVQVERALVIARNQEREDLAEHLQEAAVRMADQIGRAHV